MKILLTGKTRGQDFFVCFSFVCCFVTAVQLSRRALACGDVSFLVAFLCAEGKVRLPRRDDDGVMQAATRRIQPPEYELVRVYLERHRRGEMDSMICKSECPARRPDKLLR